MRTEQVCRHNTSSKFILRKTLLQRKHGLPTLQTTSHILRRATCFPSVTLSQTSVLMIRVFALWIKGLLQWFSQNDRLVYTKGSFEALHRKIEKCLQLWNDGSRFYPSHQCFTDVKTNLWSGLTFNVPGIHAPSSLCRQNVSHKHGLSISSSAFQLLFTEHLLCMKHCGCIGVIEARGKDRP
jgi:hypothetical protein